MADLDEELAFDSIRGSSSGPGAHRGASRAKGVTYPRLDLCEIRKSERGIPPLWCTQETNATESTNTHEEVSSKLHDPELE